jgi:hypothetical protein
MSNHTDTEQAAWARLMARAEQAATRRRTRTRPQIESALGTLLWLSEECDSGELRDQIAAVRHELHGILDARDA